MAPFSTSWSRSEPWFLVGANDEGRVEGMAVDVGECRVPLSGVELTLTSSSSPSSRESMDIGLKAA
jgi:hypothetical protein